MIKNYDSSSIYFTKNSIENLKIRITIERLGTLISGIYLANNDNKLITSGTISSRTQTSLGSAYEEASQNINLNSGSGQITNQIIEKTSFYWGQLLENNFRQDDTKYDVDTEKPFNRTYGNYDIIKKSRIFTIISNNEDSTVFKSTIGESEKIEKSFLTRNTKIKPINLITKKTKIIDNPTYKQKIEGRHIKEINEEMTIKVYLGASDKCGKNYDESQEFTVGKLVLINKKMLIINGIIVNENLKIQGKDGFYKIHFEIVDNVVLSKLSFDNESFTNLLLDEDEEKSKEEEKKIFVNICYLLTIQKTKLFPYDGVYIEYVIELPNNMMLSNKDNSVLTGRTHVSNNNWNGESFFSFPIELNCLLHLDKKFSSFPIIYFRICSEDEYNSFRINGYTSMHLPLQPGTHNHILTSWCPIENRSNYNQLYNLFLGQSLDIKEITKQCIDNKTCSSAIGIQTESRGNLYLTVSTIIQSKHLILNDEMSSLKYSVINERYVTNLSLYMKIKKVLLDFEKARNTLLLIKNKEK
uniref:26S proteasome non-ATPase regulatory subunit 14 (inferred by orthology to a human protein) n=1 Tax=Strongyloides venezuelensis TaxID=75913 RepID=A0A0K0F721_STRVS